MTDTIPEFDAEGLLPPGDYEVTLSELRSSVLVAGPKDNSRVPNWDSNWRGWLVDHLEMMVNQLWQVGVAEIFIDGSFAEDKESINYDS